ncbi:hypothetical protein FB645_005091 [Coemansia sp. IMI 203386]|nr:hypothetical protein FB645_005091 [Coemansia sp. IMI 203386]
MKTMAILSALMLSVTGMTIPTLNSKPILGRSFEHAPSIGTSFLQSLDFSHKNHKRIIGGFEMTEHGASYIVHLTLQGPTVPYVCGGTIISPTTIVTAAHCVYNIDGEAYPVQNITVGYGSSKRSEQQTTTPIEVVVHPKYSPGFGPNGLGTNDIAIINIPELAMDETTSSIRIYNHLLETGNEALALGWGSDRVDHAMDPQPDNLKGVVVAIGDKDRCHEEDASYVSPNGDEICTLNSYHPGNTSCKGDSGTGLVIKYGDYYYLTGLTSEGNSPDGNFCGIKSGFVMYTNVRSHLDFISWASGIDGSLFLGP